MDFMKPQTRSALMSQIRSKDTKPEMLVRRLLHGMGLRYRLHRKDLPGKPDITLPKWNTVVFVNGCFWHQHPSNNCRASAIPTSRQDYWVPKLARTVARDAENVAALKALGWRVLVLWECELKEEVVLQAQIETFLNMPNHRSLLET
ncbi:MULTISPECIES: very short patch repair endonuclease [unclassified Rhizobium]|uniref:very short patch repair endonuclease n=1 Tax=unclassified Rhizobium TaxID=2613769 RepID=UPI001C82D1DD|nr:MULTISPECIES: DNA mismatch endonuclease Vsr [unclassified Rhizobium]MBX5165702.1 DNA mismatch endonuclease Vsr [Rhizobium sp. NZLR4b]MBX5209127.1 DNA mismatch endonuclease Vsr [Rhizobium sp. NZLR11]